MDFDIELRFQKWVKALDDKFGGGLDVQSILFLIGVQELGQGYRKFKKDEKVDLMHIAICSLLEPYGYYQYTGNDDDGWPHYTATAQLPHLKPQQQQRLIKESILDYFEETPAEG